MQFATRQRKGSPAQIVQESPVVRNKNDRSIVLSQIFFKPLKRIKIQMVGRFVQQQQRGFLQK